MKARSHGALGNVVRSLGLILKQQGAKEMSNESKKMVTFVFEEDPSVYWDGIIVETVK